MTTYGVTPEGFVRKTLRAILADLQEAQLSTIAATLDVSSDSVLGQLNGIFARELGIAWEQLEICYHGNDPDAAEDFLLQMVAKLTGTLRRAATKSTVTLTVDLDNGKTLLAGTHFAAIEGHLDVRWTPKDDYTSPGDGPHDVVFENENTGPIPGPNGQITVIVTPLVGWNSVTNGADASLGRVVDDDSTLRSRREIQLAAVGSATTRAIAGKLEELLPDIQFVHVFENDTDYTDDNDVPPHAVEVLIFDGDPPVVDDDAIAQVIWDTKAGGIQAAGTSSGTAIIDDNADGVFVAFSRATLIPIYLSFEITTGKGYPGDAAFKEYVAEQCDARFGSSDDVFATLVESLAFGVAGVKNVTAFTLGTAPSPVGVTDIPIGLRELSRFDTGRIVVTASL